MDTLIFGDGHLGRAIASELVARGEPAPTIRGRPGRTGHDPADLPAAEVVFEASRGEAVLGNVAAAIVAGCRRFVIATTAWEATTANVEALLVQARASAVAAANLSLGVALFGRLVEHATALFGELDDVDPYVLEWHRRSKADRPSGTAGDLARRILAIHPRKQRLADPQSGRPPAADELELAVLRAGASPGMHLVGFDAPGETVELRLTARDRSAYAAGALAAADWLMAEPRTPGIHLFDEVVDDRLAGSAGGSIERSAAILATAGGG
ncbi:MAG: dihydrodipicolinate reductase C-terminal domain-containing protein [Chloroflexota bacterium]